VALIPPAVHQGYVRLGHTAHEAAHTVPIRWRAPHTLQTSCRWVWRALGPGRGSPVSRV